MCETVYSGWPRLAGDVKLAVMKSLLVLAVAFSFLTPPAILAAPRPPNVIVIFCDDLGYADIGPFGCKAYTTPHLDRMAKEGRKFTNFHVSQAVCSASRRALLTGCYNNRIGHSRRGRAGRTHRHPRTKAGSSGPSRERDTRARS